MDVLSKVLSGGLLVILCFGVIFLVGVWFFGDMLEKKMRKGGKNSRFLGNH